MHGYNAVISAKLFAEQVHSLRAARAFVDERSVISLRLRSAVVPKRRSRSTTGWRATNLPLPVRRQGSDTPSRRAVRGCRRPVRDVRLFRVPAFRSVKGTGTLRPPEKEPRCRRDGRKARSFRDSLPFAQINKCKWLGASRDLRKKLASRSFSGQALRSSQPAKSESRTFASRRANGSGATGSSSRNPSPGRIRGRRQRDSRPPLRESVGGRVSEFLPATEVAAFSSTVRPRLVHPAIDNRTNGCEHALSRRGEIIIASLNYSTFLRDPSGLRGDA